MKEAKAAGKKGSELRQPLHLLMNRKLTNAQSGLNGLTKEIQKGIVGLLSKDKGKKQA